MTCTFNELLASSIPADWWGDPGIRKWIVFALILIASLPIAWLLGFLARRLAKKKFSVSIARAFGRTFMWGFILLALFTALHQVGLNFAALLGFSGAKSVIIAGIIILFGLPLSSIAGRLVRNFGSTRFTPEVGLIFGRAIRWFLVGVVIATVLAQFGVNLGAALGAAGIVGIAVGFAAQTSLSNVISGFFLLGEKPFRVGDLIEVDGVMGTVDKIGMISASIRTPDNRSVRIPNETLVKSQVANITGNPIRRYDMQVGVAYDEDIEHVMQVLRDVADQNKHCLDEPEPLVLFTGFGDSSINFLFGTWMVCEDYLLVRNSMAIEVQKAFAREGIEIPFPHRVIAGGKANVPIEVKVTQDD
ncbi:MAG: mechanosensitive ion channel family protein [Akkermansiaceae bacterium]|nr:mechanosensitive ion channel family protein [Akkermansiaceae bacterium]